MKNKSIFEVSANKNIDEEVQKLFSFYRENGFPNYETSSYSLSKELRKVENASMESLFDEKNNAIKQSMVGLGILWTYFPHWVEVKCSGAKKSLIELWNDDDCLKELLRKTYIWKMKHNEKNWTPNRVRQNAKVYLAKQSVSNFRPSVAKILYNRYGKGGSVFDMSSGFGGRMMGFFASDCQEYIGCEPCVKTFCGLELLKKDLNELKPKKCELYNQGSEIYIESCNDRFDMCFTSPPYFDTERYSDEDTQSYKKYPTYDLWIDGFLSSTIKNCYRYLKRDGKLLINIADTPKHKLEQATIDTAEKNGFILEDIIKMELSSIAGKGAKFEPIFVFHKQIK